MELNFTKIGQRIRSQREFLGYTREQFAELIDKTPKFCSDIELGLMFLCRNAEADIDIAF